MKTRSKKCLAFLLTLAMCLSLLPGAALADDAATPGSTDFVVLSTTDVHGKIWDKNVLTDDNVNNSLLKVADAVKEIRAEYGDNVILIDNGDLFQGTPVSSYHVSALTSQLNGSPYDSAFNKTGSTTFNAVTPMALALKYIGYDAAVLGNHEFNYAWNATQSIYSYLESNDSFVNPWDDTYVQTLRDDTYSVSVISANLYWDGSDSVHTRGENVFKPYITKDLTVGGQQFKIGILGLENTDCTRWDVPDNYPGVVFSHPDDNPERDMSKEVARYLPKMQAEGCDFIILSYHSGIGSADGDLVFGQNTENQIARILANTTGIDMIIAGHDHSTGYSNTIYQDKGGNDVLVVNAGGTTLTQSVFTATVDETGSFSVALKQNEAGEKMSTNLSLSGYQNDETLKKMIAPYANAAIGYVGQTVGKLTGEWNTVASNSCYLHQSDTMDLINRSQIAQGTKYLAEKYNTPEAKQALYDATGLDHLTVDMSASSVVFANSSGYARAGDMTMKDIYKFYKYDNSLYLIPLTGQEILDILEWNAQNRLTAKVRNGEVEYKTTGDSFTNPVFYGLDFKYDMYQEPGKRVVITGFANGEPFDLAKTYVFAVNNYHLGNGPFASYSTDDAIWSQTDDLGGGTVQDLIAEFVGAAGDTGIAPAPSSWELTWTGPIVEDLRTAVAMGYPADEPTAPADGSEVLLYHINGTATLGASEDGKPIAADSIIKGGVLYSAAPAVTVSKRGETYAFQVGGKYLTSTGTSNLTLADTPTDNSWWTLVPSGDGFLIRNAAATSAYLEYYNGAFTTYTYRSGSTTAYLFSFYDSVNVGVKLAEAPQTGDKVVIYMDGVPSIVGSAASGSKLRGVDSTAVGMVLPVPEGSAVFDVTATPGTGDNEGKTFYSLTCGGKYLTYGESGNSLSLAADASNLSVWDLVADDENGGWFLHATNAAYVGSSGSASYNQYLEYYSGFTTYGMNASSNKSIYRVDFFSFDESKGFTPEAPAVPEDTDSYILPLFETTDVHGFLMDVSSGDPATYEYRLAYIANIVEQARGGNDKAVLLFDGGDIYQGNVISNLQDGKPLIAAYDAMRYDAVALGNHEFDWGVTTLIDADGTMGSYTALDGATANSAIPVLACNVYDRSTGNRVDFTQDYVILDKTATRADGATKDVKVAVVGYAPDYSSDIMAAMIAPYELREDITIAENIAKGIKARSEADAVILLAHEGASAAARQLAADTAFDLVLGGHTHSAGTGANGSGTIYLQTSNQAQGYGYAELRFDEAKAVTVKANATPSITGDKAALYEANSAALDPTVLAISKAAVAAVSDTLNTRLGYIETGVTKSAIGGNSMSSTAGNWMTDLQNRGTDSQVSFTNNGGIRTTFPLAEGQDSRTITAGDVYTIAPFCNALYVYQITYGELKDLLEAGLAARSLALRMHGIECYYSGSTVNTLVLNDQVIYDSAAGWAEGWEAKTLKVSFNEYVATSLEMLVAWNSTDKLVSKDDIDNETFISALKAEYAATGGLLYVDPNPYFIQGDYTPHDHVYVDTVHAANTTHTGYTYHECSVCGRSYIDGVVKPTSGSSGGGDYTGGGSTSTTAPGKAEIASDSSTVTVTLGDNAALTAEQTKQLIAENAEKSVVISSKTVSVVIPAGVLPEGADINAMVVDTSKPGNVIRVTAPDGTTSILPFAVVGDGSAAYIADRAGTYEIVDNAKAFPDVAPGYWASDAIEMVASREIFNGMGDGSFGTDVLMTRGMLVTVFHNIAGKAPSTSSSIDGIPSGMWYTDSAVWAADNAILMGSGSDYSLDANVSREQLCTFLIRFIDHLGIELDETSSSAGFVDAGSVSSWASSAVERCLRTGLITGKPGNQIDPQGEATRAEIATIIARMIQAAVS